MSYFKKVFIILSVVLANFSILAQGQHEPHKEEHHNEEHHGHNAIDTEEEVKNYIQHHLKDNHSYDIWKLQIPLPVILFSDGVHIFSSSKLMDENHNPKLVESNGSYFMLDHHGKLCKANSDGTVQHDEEGHSVGVLLNFSITKNVVNILLMSLFIFFLFKGVARSYQNSLKPTGKAKFLEPIIIFVRDEIAIPNIGEKHHRRFMGYLLTIFFFIWFLNLFGLTPFGSNVTNTLTVTFSLALCTFLIMIFSGNKNFWMHIFWMPGVPIPIKLLLIPIELIGLIVKGFSLMIRLFANMTAGHVVAMSIIGVLYYKFNNAGASVAFTLLNIFLGIIELLVAALQAYIFTMLSALYFGSSVQEAHH